MDPITITMLGKSTQPVLTYTLLTFVACAIAGVAYMLFRHQHRTRKARKHGHSPHTGHHGNH